MQNEALYYYWEDPISPRLLLVIPNSMKNQALELCHNLPISGHMGQTKTLLKLTQHVIWYKISVDCKLYVKSCSICNKNKRLKECPREKLKQFHSGVPLERVHMDILGPLPITKNRNKYILMVIDQFTKWLECYPLPNQGAEAIAKVFVDNCIARFGCPLEIHTDQGKNMDGNVIRQICKLLDIDKTRTTPYHPSSNGQVERFNSLILQTVRCFNKKQQNKWDEYLQLLAGAIRATPSRQTGFSPNFLMFGREVTQPIDLTFGILTANRKDKDIVEYVQNLIIALNLTHNVAREILKASQGRQNRDYDLRSKQKSYSVGDAVYKRDTATKVGQSGKLKPPWKGPYIVVKVINTVLYEIEDRKKSYVIHHDRLKLCTDKDLPIWIQRRRTNFIDQLKDTTPSEMTNEDIYDLSPLFSESTQLTSDGPMLRNDIHFVQGQTNIRSDHLDRGQQINSRQ
jgi:hypothetical protein